MDFVKKLHSLYIDGEWAAADERDAVVNPADESVLGEAPVGDAQHVEAALAAADAAFHRGPWPHLSAKERQAKLTEFLDAIDRRSGEIVDLIVAEAGSTRGLAQFLQYATPMKHARTTLDLMLRPAQTALPIDLTSAADGSTMLGGHVLSREPAGVVSAITAY